jgi:chemotaxis protein CheZ
MPVQRKVFRIEEDARAQAANRGTEDALRRRELITEIETLRDLIGPGAGADHSALERARAQIAEAQAYKHELGLIYAAVERTRSEMAALGTGADEGRRIARAGCELAAIVGGTERATQAILQAAEKIDQASMSLAQSVSNDQDQTLAEAIQDSVVQIFEACSFQDLTGQRVDRVLKTLAFVEEHVARLIAIWNIVEEFAPVMPDKDIESDRRFLNGPKLPGDRGHATQDDIDGMFRCA